VTFSVVEAERDTHSIGFTHDYAISLDESEPASDIGGNILDRPIDDSEQENRIRRVKTVEETFDSRSDGLANACAPGEERGNEED